MNVTVFIVLMLFFAVCAAICTTSALKCEYKNQTRKVIMYSYCAFMWAGIIALTILALSIK